MKKKQIWIRAGIIVIAAAAVLAAVLILLRNSDEAQYAERRGSMSEGFGQLRTVEYKGATYREKPAVTTMLIAGVDKEGAAHNVTANNYRDGGQADFLMLIAIDHTDKVIHQLQIERDTMTDVQILGIFGNEVGTRVMQICLAHSFGATPQDNAKYTVKAVQNLLDGIEIDGYYMVDYTAVPVLNDALGGVTVNVEFDMTSVNPAWTKGSTVTLHGKEAETFVRSRMTIGAGTNEERMVRQNEFMEKAIKQMNKRISADNKFGETVLNTIGELAVSNMTVKRLAEELVKSHSYQILAVDHPEGEYGFGEDGFVEFHMRDGAATEWVLEHLYTKES
ncbi:MAG: LCP family protein [Clostridia bacterium]|nr:LCP family protein [Clostridia bacterium]